jgi:hypothetical protein
MKLLTEPEFRARFADPMRQVPLDAEPPFDFWGYFDSISSTDFAGHDCSASRVSYSWIDATGHFQHVLINTEDKNTFMVVVLDLSNRSVFGHRLLDLNHEYGLNCA